MPSTVEVCNMALRHQGGGAHTISDIEEESEEAFACNTFFLPAARELQQLFLWNFTTTFAAGQLVELNPTIQWGRSFGYPSDCLHFRGIVGASRLVRRSNVIPFRIATLNGRKVILTDQDQPTFEYTAFISNPENWPPLFVRAYAYYLASYLAPALSKGDVAGAKAFALELHALALNEAKSASSREEQRDIETSSDLEESRGGW